MEKSKRSNARFGSEVTQDLQRGIRQIVLAVRPTLGPTSRVVAIERASRSMAPELMNDGGQIARRLVELADPNENVGAMLLRNLMWKQRQESGDGATTAAMIFAAVFDEGLRHIAAGADPDRLRVHLSVVCEVVIDELAGMTSNRFSQNFFGKIAKSSGADAELAEALGDIFDVIGQYGLLEIRKSYSREIRHEFIEGSYWGGTIASASMITDRVRGQARLARPGIVLGDIEMSDTSDIAKVIAQAKASGHRSMLIVGRSF